MKQGRLKFSHFKKQDTQARVAVPKHSPTKDQILKIWDKHFRPNVVLCPTYENRVLLCYDSKFDLWQFAQGGIEPGESPAEAISREIIEELGPRFSRSCTPAISFLFSEKLGFRSQNKVTVQPTIGDSYEKSISGKIYFFYHIAVEKNGIALEESEFANLKWCSLEEATTLIDSMYQGGKARISMKALQQLTAQGYIS